MNIPNFTIESLDDVRKLFTWLAGNDLLLHPDDSYTLIVEIAEDEGVPSCLTMEEAEHIDSLIDKCFDVCNLFEADIYEIACNICLDDASAGND